MSRFFPVYSTFIMVVAEHIRTPGLVLNGNEHNRHMEIERKFEVKRLPRVYRRQPHQEFIQGYTADGVRLRKAEDEHGAVYTVTKKSGSGLVREEIEEAITKEDFEREWRFTQGSRLKKTRYFIEDEKGNTYHLDVYTGKLKGHSVVEVEFESEKFARGFKPPFWFGQERTGNKRYSNSKLARDGWPQKK